jgi:cation diffusion facilitator family transporter
MPRANRIAEWIAKRGMRYLSRNRGKSWALAAKISAGIVGRSFALVADGLESGADVLNGLVVFFGLKIAVEPPDVDHPYGQCKAEPIAGSCVGLSQVAAAVMIMVESIHEILTSHRLPAPYTLVVLAGVLIVKGLRFRHLGGVGDSIGSLAVNSDSWRHRSDAITSAFAFVGISIAPLGGTGWQTAVDWAALCAGVVILSSAWHIATGNL